MCRFGSPARESQCSNAAAVSPFVSTCATPPCPVLVNAACSSTRSSASLSAASCALRIASRTQSRSSIAHSSAADLTGEKTRSNPATAARDRRASAAFDLLDLGLGRLAAGLLADHGKPRLDPRVELLQRLVGGERVPQPRGGDRLVPRRLQLPVGHPGAHVRRQVGGDDGLAVGVLAVPEQRPHLLLGDLPPGQAEQRRAPPGPPPRRVPLRGVVPRRVASAASVGLWAGSASPWAVCLVRYVYPSPAVIFAMVITMRAARFVPPRGARPADRIGCDLGSIVTWVQEVSCHLTLGSLRSAA